MQDVGVLLAKAIKRWGGGKGGRSKTGMEHYWNLSVQEYDILGRYGRHHDLDHLQYPSSSDFLFFIFFRSLDISDLSRDGE